MAKVFIDAAMLPKAFRKLDPSLKLAWYYLWTHCDKAGVWEIDEDLFEFENGVAFHKDEFLNSFEGLVEISDDKILLKDFIRIDTGAIKENYNPHKPTLRAMTKNNIKLDSSLNQACFKLVDVVVEEVVVGEKSKKEKLKKFTKSDFKKVFLDLGVDAQHLEDWVKVRESKKAAFTETALKQVLSQCQKNNYPVSEAIKNCAENSWSGFKYDWVESSKSRVMQSAPIFKTNFGAKQRKYIE